MQVDSRQEIELVRCVENDGNQKLHYVALYKTILSFFKPSADVWICKGDARFLQKLHQKQHSSAKSNGKDGTCQTLAETKPEIFSSHIYNQDLFGCNRSVMLPFPSLAEISVRPHHCWPRVPAAQ